MKKYSKFRKILVSVLLINFLLVATHKGEFWPFSIFPMFSKAGNPWTRAIVQQIDDPESGDIWSVKPLHEVAERVVGIEEYGVDPIDYANFVSKTTDWNEKRIRALRTHLGIDSMEGRQWMVTKVHGYLTDDDSVVVNTQPLFLFTSDTTYKNPNLF